MSPTGNFEPLKMVNNNMSVFVDLLYFYLIEMFRKTTEVNSHLAQR